MNVQDFDELYPGRFMKAGEFKGRMVVLTIADVELEELGIGKQAKKKGVMSFKETDKQFCMNKTNGLCIREMFGRKPAAWVGKRLVLFPSPYEGDIAIRVWGSPDIERTFEVTIELPNKKPFKMTMHKTEPGKKAAAAPAPAPAQPEPPPDLGDPLAPTPEEMAEYEAEQGGGR